MSPNIRRSAVLLTICFIISCKSNNVMEDESPALVVIQMKDSHAQPLQSMKLASEMGRLSEDLKEICRLSGLSEKDASHILLNEKGLIYTPYLVLRYFSNLSEAEMYSSVIVERLDTSYYGQIREPMAISLPNYQEAIQDRHFDAYHQWYRDQSEQDHTEN